VLTLPHFTAKYNRLDSSLLTTAVCAKVPIGLITVGEHDESDCRDAPFAIRTYPWYQNPFWNRLQSFEDRTNNDPSMQNCLPSSCNT
jgi:hypothetical protein